MCVGVQWKGRDWECGAEGPEVALRKRGREKKGEAKGREHLARRLSPFGTLAGGRWTSKQWGMARGKGALLLGTTLGFCHMCFILKIKIHGIY